MPSRVPITLCCLLLALTGVAEADEVPVPGGRFEPVKGAEGEAITASGWDVKGEARRVLVDGRGHALELAPGARLAREIVVSELAAPEGAKNGIDAARWTAIVSLDASLPAGAERLEGSAILRVELSRPGTRISFTKQLRVTTDGFAQRLVLAIPADRLVAGRWTLEIAAMGRRGFLVDDAAIFRVPTHPDEMHFAKPNGKNGPDRLESGVFGFAGLTAHEHWPLPVVAVRDGSPAARGGLAPGDVVVAVAGRPLPRSSCKPGPDWFRHGHEAILGRAAEAAFAQGEARVAFTVLRGGVLRELDLAPVKRRALPEAFPFDDDVTPELYDDLVDFVLRTRREEGRWANGGNDWIQTAFAGLALLGRRDPAHAEVIRETADWFLRKFAEPESFGNLGFWAAAYSGIFMTEYHFATEDPRVRPWIASALRWIEAGFHTSRWGTPALGHGPGGLPYGQKALMAPASHVIVFEALAQELGFQSRIFETLWPYMLHSWSDPKKQGHGAMGYNGSYRDKNEFWSRTGLFVLACRLRGERRTKVMEEHCTHIMAERHPWMRNSHAYGNPGDVWGLVGLHRGHRRHFEDVMAEWRWAVGGAWEPGFGLRHSTAHMGSPYMGGEGLVNPAMAMLLSVRHGGLLITGADTSDRGWLELTGRSLRGASVDIGVDGDGRVTLTCSETATPIRYTVDGSAPTPRSRAYDGPFALPHGGLVRAAVSDGREIGKVSRRALGLPKNAWRVVDANGALELDDALVRARRLIDGDPGIPWQPDRGEGTHGFPFSLTIDIGERRVFSGLRFSGQDRPSLVAAKWGLTAAEVDGVGREFRVGADGVAHFEELIAAKWLRIEIKEVRKGGKVRFGEMDLAWPAIVVVRDGSSISVAMDSDELVLRYTTTGKPPTRSARKVKGKIKPLQGVAVQVRRFDAKGNPVGPIVFVE